MKDLMTDDSKQSWIGVGVGIALTLGFVYLVAKVASAGWASGK